MNDSKISVRYAKALFLSGKEENLLEVVLKDMKLIQSTSGVKGFKEYIESPVIKTSTKKALIKKVFSENISELSMRFYNLVLTNRRETYLEGIIRNFIALYREDKGIKSANLKVPFHISENNRKKFISLLEDTYRSKIEMVEQVDAELIGGFILKVEDEQYDASVKSGLAKIKKKLLETPIEN